MGLIRYRPVISRNLAQSTPKLVTILRDGDGVQQLKADGIAGLTVAVIALSLALALASGASPDQGLVTVILLPD